jgi:hypothetical protein
MAIPEMAFPLTSRTDGVMLWPSRGKRAMKCPTYIVGSSDAYRRSGDCAPPPASAKVAPPSLAKTLKSPLHAVPLCSIYAGRRKSPGCFSARVFSEPDFDMDLFGIETVFCQGDAAFIGLLNAVRNHKRLSTLRVRGRGRPLPRAMLPIERNWFSRAFDERPRIRRNR